MLITFYISINRTTIKIYTRGLGGIRSFIDSSQKTYTDIYKKADRPLRIKTAQNQFIGLFPDIYGSHWANVFSFLAILLKQRGSTGESEIALLVQWHWCSTLVTINPQIYLSWSDIKGNWKFFCIEIS